ncbi:hypothetical protein LIA77_03658 [Sarocladium implicatum]|nr:hypothetical protein LIA77_03658 [Sarocladium implicatum]
MEFNMGSDFSYCPVPDAQSEVWTQPKATSQRKKMPAGPLLHYPQDDEQGFLQFPIDSSTALGDHGSALQPAWPIATPDLDETNLVSHSTSGPSMANGVSPL